MSTSHARRAVRGESEDESDHVPIRPSLQISSKKSSHTSSIKKPSDPLAESFPQKKSRKKTAENAFGPQKALLLTFMSSLLFFDPLLRLILSVFPLRMIDASSLLLDIIPGS